MNQIHIRRLHARYRLPPGAGGERRRLDRLAADALGDAIEEALAREPLAPREELCIRRLPVAVRLRLATTDAALATAWGEAVATAIRRARRGETTAEGGDSPGDGTAVEVVRYASREQALVDMAIQVAGGGRRRAWAWRQLDLWRTDATATDAEAVRELVRTLVRQPASIVPILLQVERQGRWPVLAERLEVVHWMSLAAAALDVGGVSLDRKVLDVRPLPGVVGRMDFEERARQGQADVGAEVSRGGAWSLEERSAASGAGTSVPGIAGESAGRVIRHSRFGRGCPVGRLDPAVERALAVLMILEVDPGWTARPQESWMPFLDQIVRLRQSAQVRGRRVKAQGDPGRGGTGGSGMTHRGGGFQEEAGGADLGEPGPLAESLESRDDALPEDPRQRGSTRLGGLLFLLNLLPSVGVPGRVMVGFPGHSLRWVLHRLGMQLAGVARAAGRAASGAAVSEGEGTESLANDPAVLAFAGLSPGTAPAWDEEATAQDAESLGRLGEAVAKELERRMPGQDPGPGGVLAGVCVRRADIAADPGWIEVRFSLKDVSTEVRRAGLDLDPGYIPWLGVVVTFAYE